MLREVRGLEGHRTGSSHVDRMIDFEAAGSPPFRLCVAGRTQQLAFIVS